MHVNSVQSRKGRKALCAELMCIKLQNVFLHPIVFIRDEVTGEWRRLHIEEPHELCTSPNIKKNEMGGVCGTYGRQERCIQGFGVGIQRGRVHLQNLGVDGRILKWVLRCVIPVVLGQ